MQEAPEDPAPFLSVAVSLQPDRCRFFHEIQRLAAMPIKKESRSKGLMFSLPTGSGQGESAMIPWC
jgi:hypothetical protein